jgi:single-stranded DNA-binding protein
MSKSAKKVFLLGNLGKDAELKYTPSGTLVAWNRTAEVVDEDLKRGSKV